MAGARASPGGGGCVLLPSKVESVSSQQQKRSAFSVSGKRGAPRLCRARARGRTEKHPHAGGGTAIEGASRRCPALCKGAQTETPATTEAAAPAGLARADPPPPVQASPAAMHPKPGPCLSDLYLRGEGRQGPDTT